MGPISCDLVPLSLHCHSLNVTNYRHEVIWCGCVYVQVFDGAVIVLSLAPMVASTVANGPSSPWDAIGLIITLRMWRVKRIIDGEAEQSRSLQWGQGDGSCQQYLLHPTLRFCVFPQFFTKCNDRASFEHREHLICWEEYFILTMLLPLVVVHVLSKCELSHKRIKIKHNLEKCPHYNMLKGKMLNQMWAQLRLPLKCCYFVVCLCVSIIMWE